MYRGWGMAICLLWCCVWGNVVELTDSNFDVSIKSSNVIMVKFFAPWCGHCKTLAPEYERAAEMIKSQGKSYVLAELDATVHTKAAQRHHVQGYPTVLLFLNGQPMKYEGERKAESIVQFIDRKTRPPSTQLSTAAEIKNVQESKGLRVGRRVTCLVPPLC